jgi:hypothetical protein
MREKLGIVVLLCLAAACGGPGANTPARSPLAEKWLARAKQSFKTGDFDDAKTAAESALQAAPADQEARLLNARIALAALNFGEAVKLTQNLPSSEAHGVRGRALWYSGDIEAAADELETMLQDPSVKDPWAREIAKLARRGQGRHPFEIEGGVVEAVEMPRVGVPALIVPCELEGERILALVATAVGEVIVDSSSRREPAWVNLRFGEHIEVRDVPALTQDLSAVSRQLNAPIKALLGVNLLRHVHVTFDRRGDQFVVRRSEPPPPPDASRIPLWYVRGGGMLLRAQVSPKEEGQTTMLVDSSTFFPLALPPATYQRAGVDPAKLKMEPQVNAKTGILPTLKVGGIDLPQFPFMEGGAPLEEIQRNIDVDLGGIMGAGLLSLFRVTFADEGRFVWLEPDPTLLSGEPPPRHQGPPPDLPPEAPPGDTKQPAPKPEPMKPDAPKPEPKKPAPSQPGAKK